MRVISADQLERMRLPFEPSAECTQSAHFTIAGITFEVRGNVRDAIAELQNKYADHAGGEKPKFSYHVCETDEGYAFWCAHDGGWLWKYGRLSSSLIAFLADAAIISALVHFDGTLRSIHAAGVAYGDRGALIVGDSTAGKTTTLLACARAGLRVYSDERGLLRGSMLQPFLRKCTVRSGGRALLLDDERHDDLASFLLTGAPISLRECFGDTAIGSPAPLRAVFILNGSAEHPEITPIDAASALPPVARWFDAKGDRLDRLAQAVTILRQAQCYRLVLGTTSDSAAAIARTLEALR